MAFDFMSFLTVFRSYQDDIQGENEELFLIFSGAGKFCLAHGLRQSHETLKMTSAVYKRSLRALTKNAE